MGSKISFYNITDHKLTNIDDISDLYVSSKPNQTLYSLIKNKIPVLYISKSEDYDDIKHLNWEGKLIIIEGAHLLNLGISKCDDINNLIKYNSILNNFISSIEKDNLYTESYWDNRNCGIYTAGRNVSELACVTPEISIFDEEDHQYAFFNPVLRQMIDGSKYMSDICNIYDGYDTCDPGIYISNYSSSIISELRSYFIDYEKDYVNDMIEYMNTIKNFINMIHELNTIESDVEFLEYLRSNVNITEDRLKNAIDKYIEENKKEKSDIEILKKYLKTDPELENMLKQIIEKGRSKEE